MSDRRSRLAQAGDPMPFCYGIATDGQFYSLEAQAGRAAVMIVVGAGMPDTALACVEDFAAQSEAFVCRGADVVILAQEDAVRALRDRFRLPDSMQVIDCAPVCLGECDVPASGVVVLVIDRNRRIAMRLTPPQDRGIACMCLACLDRLPIEPAQDVILPAPVLLLPNLFGLDLCADLITLFESGPHVDGGMTTSDPRGTSLSRFDHAKKSRRDLLISPDSELHLLLRGVLLRRCAPEIAKAFQANIAYVDRILVARYDQTGVGFLRHRDNLSANVAFREFAISVNLNAGDYDGGHLLFPEFNDHRYRPGAGAGIVFSASLLHEATPVTSGCRYVLLTFFHGEAAETKRVDFLTRHAA